MAGNTVYGPFIPDTIVAGVTPINKTICDHWETQAATALYSLNPNLSGPFVVTGITCTKDGSVANQLDIASGYAFITMSDGSIGSISVVSDNTHTTSTPSTTYYLFLKNDGTWQWGTSSSGPANSLPICQVATDGSGNISTVTDTRHTGGSSGLGLVVARARNVNVTSTAATTVLNYTPSVAGLYMVCETVWYVNATPQKVILDSVYVDSAPGGTATVGYFLMLSSASAGQLANGSQANTPGNNQSLALAPQFVNLQAGQPLTVNIHDGGGTPNHYVSVAVIRLS